LDRRKHLLQTLQLSFVPCAKEEFSLSDCADSNLCLTDDLKLLNNQRIAFKKLDEDVRIAKDHSLSTRPGLFANRLDSNIPIRPETSKRKEISACFSFFVATIRFLAEQLNVSDKIQRMEQLDEKLGFVSIGYQNCDLFHFQPRAAIVPAMCPSYERQGLVSSRVKEPYP